MAMSTDTLVFAYGSLEHVANAAKKRRSPTSLRLVEQIANPVVELVQAVMSRPAWRAAMGEEEEEEEEDKHINVEHSKGELNSGDKRASGSVRDIRRDGLKSDIGHPAGNDLVKLQGDISKALHARGMQCRSRSLETSVAGKDAASPGTPLVNGEPITFNLIPSLPLLLWTPEPLAYQRHRWMVLRPLRYRARPLSLRYSLRLMPCHSGYHVFSLVSRL